MRTVEESVDVRVPPSDAYERWTRFEEFRALTVPGGRRESDAEITEQRPGERIAWRSTSGARQAGTVTFARLDDRSTRVTVRIEEEPEGLVERAGEALGLLDRRVRSDLERFKETVEAGGGHVTPGEEAPPTADTVPAGTESTAGSPGPTPMREQGGM